MYFLSFFSFLCIIQLNSIDNYVLARKKKTTRLERWNTYSLFSSRFSSHLFLRTWYFFPTDKEQNCSRSVLREWKKTVAKNVRPTFKFLEEGSKETPSPFAERTCGCTQLYFFIFLFSSLLLFFFYVSAFTTFLYSFQIYMYVCIYVYIRDSLNIRH